MFSTWKWFSIIEERIKLKNASKDGGSEAGMELFLTILAQKVSHPDRWFRFVDAIKKAGILYSVSYHVTLFMFLLEKKVIDHCLFVV